MRTVRFGDVASRLNIHVDQDNTNLEYYVGGEHIDSREFLITKKAPIKGSTIGYQFQFGFREGDILFMTKNPHLRKCSLVEFDGLCSIATFVIHSNDENILLQKYLLLEMQTDRFWEYCEAHKSGGVNYFITWGTLSNYIFDIPDIDIQKKSADKAWAAYELKLSYRDMIKATDEMLKSQFIEMFGSKSSGDKWPIKYLSEIVDPNCPISYGIVQPGDELEDGVPIVRPVDLNSNYYVYKNGLKRTTEAISNSYKRTILRGDELLLCVRGTTGVMGLATEELKGGNVTRGITPLYFKEGFNRIYLLGAFLSDDVQAYIKDNTVGSTLKGINMERVRKIQIPIPPIECKQ